MKLALFGASGKVGRNLTRQALAAGHEVTALVRSLKADLPEHPNLTLVVGDVLNPEDVANVVDAKDAVLVALGAPLGNKEGIRTKGTAIIVKAMKEAAVERLICLSGFGAGESRGALPWLYRFLIMPLILRHVYADHEQQEVLVKQSALDWTLVRPTNYVEGPQTNDYRIDFKAVEKGMTFKISYANVAHFMLSQVRDRTFLHAAPSLSS
ncbi:SDR family oxidoreductase [Cohaesibacter sp. CAU 1516]|uniref:NAD(P)-dependent oxidoreductase n=1 Tax=Cohaesibacter sp. CAU 1516 TaxID=2576038 RepID=UPI0010FD9C10|nr:SDR family oxidoreductase [Cohaesibacter sp. CAU 1516]TLP44992.1 SDR family oxidoreductase [Cohaesibacter sp. CAU 1516]